LKAKLETFEDQIITIDASQGRQIDHVILSCVRSNKKGGLGFLTEFERINVALTRAKHGLIIVADVDTLKVNKKWKEVLQTMNGQIVSGFNGAKRWIEERIEAERNEP